MKNKIVLFFDGYKILYLYLKRWKVPKNNVSSKRKYNPGFYWWERVCL